METSKTPYGKATEEIKKDAIWSSGYLLERRVSAAGEPIIQ